MPDGNSFSTYFPLVGPVVIILTFTIDRVIAYNQRKKEQSRNWYYKVIIEPNIEVIEKYFSDVSSCFKSSLELILKCKAGEEISIKAVANSNIKSINSEFELKFVFLVETTQDMLLDKLMPILREIDDEFVNHLDSYKSSNKVEEAFERSIASQKSKFYQTLYLPLKTTKKSKK